MSKNLLSCVFAAGVSLFSIQSATAGGDIIPVVPAEEPVQTTSSWTGFSVGGGLGVQKLGADVNVDSLTKSRSADYKKCGKNNFNISSFLPINDPVTGIPDPALFDYAWACMEKYDATANYNYHGLGHHYADYAFNKDVEADGDWSAFGTVQIGYDYQLTKRIVLGGFANLDFGEAKADFSFSHTGPTTGDGHPKGRSFKHVKKPTGGVHKFADYGPVGSDVSGTMETDLSMTVGGRLGVLLNDKTLAYGLVGYTRTEVSGVLNFGIQKQFTDAAMKSNKFIPVNLSKRYSESLDGLTVGLGGERKLNDRWSIKAEYRYTWLGSIDETLSKKAFDKMSRVQKGYKTWTRSVDSETTFDIDPHVNSFRVLLNYNF